MRCHFVEKLVRQRRRPPRSAWPRDVFWAAAALDLPSCTGGHGGEVRSEVWLRVFLGGLIWARERYFVRQLVGRRRGSRFAAFEGRFGRAPGGSRGFGDVGEGGEGGWDATGRLTKGVRDQADEDVSAAAVRVGRCCKWRLLTSHLYGVQKRSCLHAQSAV